MNEAIQGLSNSLVRMPNIQWSAKDTLTPESVIKLSDSTGWPAITARTDDKISLIISVDKLRSIFTSGGFDPLNKIASFNEWVDFLFGVSYCERPHEALVQFVEMKDPHFCDDEDEDALPIIDEIYTKVCILSDQLLLDINEIVQNLLSLTTFVYKFVCFNSNNILIDVTKYNKR